MLLRLLYRQPVANLGLWFLLLIFYFFLLFFYSSRALIKFFFYHYSIDEIFLISLFESSLSKISDFLGIIFTCVPSIPVGIYASCVINGGSIDIFQGLKFYLQNELFRLNFSTIRNRLDGKVCFELIIEKKNYIHTHTVLVDGQIIAYVLL